MCGKEERQEEKVNLHSLCALQIEDRIADKETGEQRQEDQKQDGRKLQEQRQAAL